MHLFYDCIICLKYMESTEIYTIESSYFPMCMLQSAIFGFWDLIRMDTMSYTLYCSFSKCTFTMQEQQVT